VTAQRLDRDQDRRVVGVLLDDRVELVGDDRARGHHVVRVRRHERARAAVPHVGAVLAHRAVDLALRQVDLLGAARRRDGLQHDLLVERADPAAVLVDGDLHVVVVVVGDDHRVLLHRRVVGEAERRRRLVVEVGGPEVTADVGRLGERALARRHAGAVAAHRAGVALLEQRAAGAVAIAHPHLIDLAAVHLIGDAHRAADLLDAHLIVGARDRHVVDAVRDALLPAERGAAVLAGGVVVVVAAGRRPAGRDHQPEREAKQPKSWTHGAGR
jgi:hypothetical protein